jgi:hypothetical protein
VRLGAERREQLRVVVGVGVRAGRPWKTSEKLVGRRREASLVRSRGIK